MRKTVFLLTVLVGLVLVAIGFLLSAPMFAPTESEVYSNPRLPFAPGIFTLGIILIFVAPVLYELLPGRRA